MRKIVKTGIFKRDYKRIKRRGYPELKLIAVLQLLIADEPLPEKCRPHKLVGEYFGYWECHISPDWLLIYELNEEDELILKRTGSHSDLFD